MTIIRNRDSENFFLCNEPDSSTMELEYCVPPGFLPGMNTHPSKIAELGASLRGVDSRHGAKIPGTPLNIRPLLMLNGANIEFGYQNELAYRLFQN